MAWLHPHDGPQVAYEFFAPFAHLPGRYELCRIRSPTHGAFDTFIVLADGKARSDEAGVKAAQGGPATVYVHSDAGEAFMRERYPECTAIRVAEEALSLTESQDGRTVVASVRSDEGPLRAAHLRIAATPHARPRNEPYGGTGRPVWGSKRWTCWGVDLVVDATASGHVERDDGAREEFNGEPALLTLGSFARIMPLPGLVD